MVETSVSDRLGANTTRLQVNPGGIQQAKEPHAPEIAVTLDKTSPANGKGRQAGDGGIVRQREQSSVAARFFSGHPLSPSLTSATGFFIST